LRPEVLRQPVEAILDPERRVDVRQLALITLVLSVEDKINNRLMKCLDFKTPAEVLTSLVALTG